MRNGDSLQEEIDIARVHIFWKTKVNNRNLLK